MGRTIKTKLLRRKATGEIKRVAEDKLVVEIERVIRIDIIRVQPPLVVVAVDVEDVRITVRVDIVRDAARATAP